MRAGVIRGKGLFELAEVAEPRPGEGQAVVEISRCGICGSDVHAFVEGWPYAPAVCGHEWIGVVSDVAKGVSSVHVGDRVAGAVSPGCGTCAECRASHPEFCAFGRATYAGRLAAANGGFARAMALHASRLCPVPATVNDDDAALLEPATVAMHGVRRSRLRVGDVTCVVGCGPIGLLTLQCAKIAGAGRVIAVEPDAGRRERALAVGADAALAPAFGHDAHRMQTEEDNEADDEQGHGASRARGVGPSW